MERGKPKFLHVTLYVDFCQNQQKEIEVILDSDNLPLKGRLSLLIVRISQLIVLRKCIERSDNKQLFDPRCRI